MWERYDPAEYATIGSFLRDPEKVWTMLSEMIDILGNAVPNAAHRSLADLERMGILRSVITQNVDGLHQAAGSRKVIEFHGNAEGLVCISCWKRYASREKIRDGIPPRCACGEILKPDLVLFGEPIPWVAQTDAGTEAEECSVLLVAGTSAEVSPACEIPKLSKKGGEFVIEINPEETQLTRTVADLHIQAAAGDALSALVSAIRGN